MICRASSSCVTRAPFGTSMTTEPPRSRSSVGVVQFPAARFGGVESAGA
jgi:hypothetical protein